MRHLRRMTTFLLLAGAMVSCRPEGTPTSDRKEGTDLVAEPQATAGVADQDAERAIRSLIAKYAQAVYARSVDTVDTELASTVWANTPEVSFIHPRGHEHGWDAIKTNFYEQTMGANFTERKLSVRDIAIHTSGNSAWVEFYWDFVAKLRKDGSPLTTHGRESQVYRKIDGEWRLVHAHYSGMPVTGDRSGF